MYHNFQIDFEGPSRFNKDGDLIVNVNDSARLQAEYRSFRRATRSSPDYNEWVLEQLKDSPRDV
jgi:hypothetical protein